MKTEILKKADLKNRYVGRRIFYSPKNKSCLYICASKIKNYEKFKIELIVEWELCDCFGTHIIPFKYELTKQEIISWFNENFGEGDESKDL